MSQGFKETAAPKATIRTFRIAQNEGGREVAPALLGAAPPDKPFKYTSARNIFTNNINDL